MSEREFEVMLKRIMKTDLSAGTETFREALLERCLSELGTDSHAVDNVFGEVVSDYRELDDSALDQLAAAGNVYAPGLDDTKEH